MKKDLPRLTFICLAFMLLAGCASSRTGETSGTPVSEPLNTAAQPVPDQGDAPVIEGLTYESTLPLEYAKMFSVYRYEGGYSLIEIENEGSWLVVPEGGKVPAGAANYGVIRQPLENIYLVASSAMALFRAVGGMGAIRFSGTKEEAWYIDEAVQAMQSGDLIYAGKYSAPDYELLVNGKCDLAIETTMIYHSPEAREKLEELGIPVLVERSSYESHPLGRTEWVKLYAVLLGREAQAEAAFREQAKILDELSGFENTGKTVAFFYVTNAGTVSVRKSSDYVPVMIELAGGRYIFPELGDPDSASSGVSMTMEEFYDKAKDADYLIYNATIDAPMDTLAELLGKSELFSDFKAVQDGNVWCTGKYLFQATDVLGGMIGDIHTILTSTGESDLTFIHKLK